MAPVPEAVIYYFSAINPDRDWDDDFAGMVVPAETILTEVELIPHLFREEDAHFRRWVALGPYAVTERETVIDVSIRDGAWTDTRITGEHAYPHEPFQLSGPPLPGTWREGQPKPLVTLPRLRTGALPTGGCLQ